MIYIRIDKAWAIFFAIVLILGTFSTGFVSAIDFDDENSSNDIKEIYPEKNRDEQEYYENHIEDEKEKRTDRSYFFGNGEAFIEDNFSNIDSRASPPRLDSLSNFREREDSLFEYYYEDYTSREPIKIDSDEHFEEKADENNWSGDGTEEDPYIIEGYEITSEEDDPDEYGISIGNTTVHFVVRDCYLENKFEGITLSNVTNYTIENNELRGPRFGSQELKILSSTNGFIINNTIVGPGPYTVQFLESHGNIIHNNSINSGNYPIHLERSNQNEISGNDLLRSEQGVRLLASDNNTLVDNIATDLMWGGFLILNSDNTYLQNNSISGGSWVRPLELYMANGTIATDNLLKFTSPGAIEIKLSRDITLINNEMDSQHAPVRAGMGIMISGPRLENWNTHRIEDSNTVNGEPVLYLNDRKGESIIVDDLEPFGQLILANCTEMTIEDQAFKDDDYILMGFSDDNIISNNEFSNMTSALVISASTGNEVAENNFSENQDGIWLKTANHNVITENSFIDNLGGVRVEGVNNKITQNFFSTIDGPSMSAINIGRGEDNQIYQNRIDDLRVGILLEDTENNEIIENDIKNTSRGIGLRRAKNNEIIENAIKNTTRGIRLDRANNNSLIHNNITDGYGGILAEISRRNNIFENVIFNNSEGLVLAGSDDNNIADNILKMNKHRGVNVTDSTKNIFSRNTIKGNLNGIELLSSDENIIKHNNLSENDEDALKFRLSSDNILENNTISSNNDHGISLDDNSDRNKFVRNTVSKNEGYGVLITFSNDNLFYHNRFIENEDQALDTEDNIWNKSYPIGGNYWSDHTEPDDYSGPDQDESGSDGIVDRSRSIDGFEPHSEDYYPWTNPDFVSPIHVSDPHPVDESEEIINRTSLSVHVEADMFPTTVVFYLDGEEVYEETIENEGRVETTTFDFDLNTTYDWHVETVNDEGSNRTISPSYSFTTVSERVLYELELDIGEGEGTIKVDGTEVELPYIEEYPIGIELELEGVPVDGYRFVEWKGDHTLEESESPKIEIVMDENKSLTANFRKEYELTINIDGEGTVKVDGVEWADGDSYTFGEGTEVELEAIPDDGWEFDEWQGNDETGEEITITMEEDKEITAYFEEEDEWWQIPGFTTMLLIFSLVLVGLIYTMKKE